VARHPDRFAGFAVLPLQDSEAAAAELERCVTRLGFKGAMTGGMINGKFLDDRRFDPVLAAAQRLDVPIYVHPAPPPRVVFDVYFSGLPDAVAQVLSTSGWGWHAETGLHALRMIVGGVFDRFPKLQIIIGHMGENVPFSLARADSTLNRVATTLERPVADYFTGNFHITTSAYFTDPPLLCALMVLGADRIMFSVDYPYSSNAEGAEFLKRAPISPDDRAKIAHRNVEKLLRL
jgi:predicted TIM-barrel fold metal-dependent hydrolase